MAESLVIVDPQFESAFDAAKPRISASVVFRHMGLLSLSAFDLPEAQAGL